MEGDFPFWIQKKQKLELYIPERTFDEIKWINRNIGMEPDRLEGRRSSKLERQCFEAYFIKPGIGYIGTKYVYEKMEDLIGRRTFFKSTQETETYHKLKCTGIQRMHGSEFAVFSDHILTRSFSDETLSQMGYVKILK